MRLAGVSMGFASLAGSASAPTGARVTKSSYECPEAWVPLKSDGGRLHVILGESGNLKLTLLKEGSITAGTSGLKLNSISIETMQNAIDSKMLQVDGKTYALDDVRAIRRMVNNILRVK